MGRVVVAVEDVYGNTVSDVRTNVTVAIGTNPARATLSGTTTAGAVSGVAVFSDLAFDKSGKGYTLVAAATGLTEATSRTFDVDPIPRMLAFAVQPTALASGAIEPAVQVAVEDENGNTVAAPITNVTLAIGSNPAGANLSGTTMLPTANGVAVFANLTIDRTGTYTLSASASGLTGATSSPFEVGNTLQNLLPACAPVGGGAFGLDVQGSNFVDGSVVRWNGSNRSTTFSQGELFAQILASDIAGAGTAYVTVLNAASGISSNALPFPVPAPGVGPSSIAVDPTGTFAYVANGGCPDTFPGNVSMFRIDGSTGALSSIGPPVAADFGPHSLIVDPSGRFVYVANDGAFEVNAGSVSMYAIDAITGALTSNGQIVVNTPPFSIGVTPYSIAVHPSGKFAYATLEGGLAPTGIATFAIDATGGALTLTGQTSSAGRAIAVAIHPSGKFAYVINEIGFVSGDTISVCSIEAAGTLNCAGTVATGPGARTIAIDPSGRFAYVANSGIPIGNSSGTFSAISMYSIDATTGVLTSIGTMGGSVGGTYSIAVHPSGKFAVALDGSETISMYSIDATTGTLYRMGGAATGTLPSAIAVEPTGRFAYVTNSGSNDVSMYSIDTATGALTLIGKIGT